LHFPIAFPEVIVKSQSGVEQDSEIEENTRVFKMYSLLICNNWLK